MNKKKILSVGSYFPPYGAGGAERTAMLHSEILLKDGWDINIATLNHGKLAHNLSDKIKIYKFSKNLNLKKGEQIDYRIFNKFFFIARYSYFLIKIIRSARIDIVHSQTHDLYIPCYIASIFTGVKLFSFIRDTSYICAYGASCLLYQDHEQLLEKCSISHKFKYLFREKKNIVNKIYFITKNIINEMISKIKLSLLSKSEKIVFISHGIKNLYKFVIDKKIHNKFHVAYCPAIKEKYEEPKLKWLVDIIENIKNQNGKIILYVGKLSYGKGGEIIKKIHDEVIRNKENFHFIIAGNIVSNLNFDKKNIYFTNFLDQNNLSFLYESCDVVFVPSIWPEPLGWANLDAAMHKKPIVSSEVGGIPEVVKHNRTGFLFKKNNYKEAYFYLKKILSSKELSNKFGHEAYEHIKSNFGFKKILNQLREIYY